MALLRGVWEEPLCDEEVKMQLSCFMCLHLIILSGVKCLSMSPRPDLIPGGTARDTAVPCSCLSGWPHGPVPSEQRRDVRNAQTASSPEPGCLLSVEQINALCSSAEAEQVKNGAWQEF